MGNLEVGNRVRVRQWDDMQREFGLSHFGDIACPGSFVQAMRHLCGKTAIVTAVHDKNVELVFHDDVKDTNWEFTTAMIEKVLPS